MDPRATGGPNGVDNLVCSCKGCNEIKAAYVADSIEDARHFIETQRRRREEQFITSSLRAAGYAGDGRYTMLDLLFTFAEQGKEVLV